jgi:hypothetical protein
LDVTGDTSVSTSLTVDGLYFGSGSGDGDNNLAIGSSMGSGTGKRNTAIGSSALESYSGTGFDNNTAVGYSNMRALSTGSGNTALGAENMFSLTTGSANTSIGNQTMLAVSTGSNNTGLGQRAGQSITTGANNTLIGLNADVSSSNANNETVIGKDATGQGDNTVTLGNDSVTSIYMAEDSGATVYAAGLNLGGVAVTSNATELNILDGVTSTAAELNILDGVTASATELNLIDGVTATTTELNYVDGVTSNIQTQLDAIGSSSDINGGAIDGTTVGASSASTGAFTTLTSSGATSLSTSGGNVGIGTTSPSALLHIKDASSDAVAIINAYGEDDEAHLMLRTGGINKTAIVATGLNNWGRTDLRFILNSSTNANDYGLSDTRMIIKNDGDVGIGTSSPSEKLDVSGNIKASGSITASTLTLGGTTLTSSAAELNYVDGVTSNIQTQLDAIGSSSDINGGAIDGTTVGASSASTGAFTTLTSSGATSIATGGGVVNIASTGVMTTVEGTLNVDEAVTLDSTLDVTGNVTSSGGSISGFDAALNDQTSTSYTLQSSDNGKVVTLDNASAITLTIPSGLGDGFNCLIVQKGNGQISLTASGTNLINRQNHSKTAGRYAVLSIVNIGSETLIVAGDTGS